MDIKALQYFVTVVACGSVTRAATRLRISQPSLGWQIRKLEEELDATLIVRHSRGIEPTKAGLLLAEHAREILARTNAAVAQVRELAKEPRGSLNLGMTASARTLLAVPLLHELSKRAPHLNLNIVEELSGVLIEWLTTGRIDLALTYAFSDAPGLCWQALAGEPLYLIESSRRGGPAGKTVSYAKAIRHRLAMPTMSHRHTTFLEQMAAAKGAKLDIIYQVQSIATIRDLVEQDAAATILPYGVLAQEIARGVMRARRIVEPEMMLDLFLCRPELRALSSNAHLVCDTVSELAGRIITKSPGIWRAIEAPAEGMSRMHSAVAVLNKALSPG
jgi:LysR family nitrogen assimilation transcriptional regulator